MRDLQIGASALINFQRAMDVTAHNIANAATPGYSRQRPEFESVEGQRFGRAYYGNGATIRTVTRSSDAFLEREANRTSSLAAGPNQRLESLKALESLVPTGPNGLQTMLSDAASAWNDVVDNPQSASAREILIQKNTAFAERVRSTASGVDEMARSAQLQRAGVVSQIEGLGRSIAGLNKAISESNVPNSPPNDLLDQRDYAISQLSGLIDTTTVDGPGGTKDVYVGGSFALVNGVQSQAFKQDSVSSATLSGGTLKGLNDFIEQDLPGVKAKLTEMTRAFGTAFNTQHSLGVQDSGAPGGVLFQNVDDPSSFVFAITDPKQLALSSKAQARPVGANTGLEMGAVTTTSATAGALPFTLQFDGQGQWSSDGGANWAAYTPGKPIETQGYSIALTGTPSANAQIEIAAAPPGTLNNGNAKALSQVRDHVGADGIRVEERGIAVSNFVGGQVSSTKTIADFSTTLSQDASARRNNTVGVNLEEEATKMMQYQRSYEAAAQIIKTSQRMWDALISAV